jgi:hypothetical protein
MKFNNLGDVLMDEKLIYFINEKISYIYFKKSNVKVGHRLNRSAINYLEEHNLFNSENLIKEYIEIIGKKNNLPSSVREFIMEIVRQSIIDTIKFYERKDKKQLIYTKNNGKDNR